ncbi:unnamed protein product, partial [Prorocentrum cordatum]
LPSLHDFLDIDVPALDESKLTAKQVMQDRANGNSTVGVDTICAFDLSRAPGKIRGAEIRFGAIPRLTTRNNRLCIEAVEPPKFQRFLTLKERFLLLGYPPEFDLHSTFTAQWGAIKASGNAMSVPCLGIGLA